MKAELENGNYNPTELHQEAHQTMVDLIDYMTSALMDYANSREIVITVDYAKKIMQSGTLTALQSFQSSTNQADQDLSDEIAAIVNAERLGQQYTITISNDITITYEQQGFPLSLSNPCELN
nr:hypothetical protein [uncultured Lacinutrix sp.]